MERAHVIVHGMVQGVFFRAGTIRQAQLLGLTGCVRNLPDGTVEAIAEGPRPALDQFVDWCRRGPEAAHVECVDVDWEESCGEYAGFKLC